MEGGSHKDPSAEFFGLDGRSAECSVLCGIPGLSFDHDPVGADPGRYEHLRRICAPDTRGLLRSGENEFCVGKTLRQLNGDLHASAGEFSPSKRSAQYDNAGNGLAAAVSPIRETVFENVKHKFTDAHAFKPDCGRYRHQ
jgi:hypothetical protein